MPGTTSGTASGRRPWPLVGRSVDLERLEDVLAGTERRGGVITGPAGVGKSRLAEELLQAAAGRGAVVGRAAGAVGAAAAPLGALVHLLPRPVLEQRFDPIGLYAAAVDSFRERAADGPFVLLVDDLQLLDPTSLVLLAQLLDAEALRLVATVRTGEPVDDAARSLLTRADLLSVDLAPLTRDDLDALLHLALGGPVDGRAVEGIWSASLGNPLFVRELVGGALADGRLVERRGSWWLAGPLEATARLAEAVEARLATAPPEARPALDLLALWQAVGVVELDDLVGAAPAEALEASGWIVVRADGRRRHVSLAHPLYGEALRRRMPQLTRRRLLLGHAERLDARGARRREDPLQIASARLDATGAADPALLTRAARLARYGHDFSEVERLAGAAVREGGGPEAALLLAEARHELGRYEETEQLLAQADWVAAADDEALRLQLMAIRIRNLVFGLQRSEEAAALNRAAHGLVQAPEAHDELRTDEATTLLFSNRPLEALELVEPLRAVGAVRTRVLAATVAAPALSIAGRAAEALEVAERALVEHAALGDQLAIANPGIHWVYRLQALIELGRFQEAEELAAAGHAASTSGGGPPIGRVWWSFGRGRLALLSGRPASARRWLAESVTVAGEAGFDGPRRLALSLLAAAAAAIGATGPAAAAVAELDELPPWGYYGPDQELGRAWAAAASGDPRTARAVLLASADDAAGSGYVSAEAWLRHDVVRLGAPEAVADRLAELGRTCQGALVPAYAEHAVAAAADDPAGLDEASRRFEAIGARLLAAEAATEAGHAHQRRSAQRPATASLARAAALSAGCEGARTPALVTTASVVPLTKREREIGLLAAEGVTSRDIAGRLYLSVRTVENHLQRTYTKLGVGNRAELADALMAGEGDVPPSSRR